MTDAWRVTDVRSNSGSRSFHSGVSGSGAGDTRLVSPIIDLSTLKPGAKVTLSFEHLYHFDDCGDFDFDSDGAVLEIMAGLPPFDVVEPIEPVGGYGDTLDDTCQNPLAYSPAFTHDTGGELKHVEVDLSAYVGRPIRMAFHVGWDCGNCALEEGWYIDDVRVERTP